MGNGKVKVSPVDEVTVRTNANCQYTYCDIRKSICRIFSPANTFFDVYGNFFKVFFYFIYNFLPTFVLVNRKGYLSFASMKGMCNLFPDKMLRKSMAKMCGVADDTRKRMEEMLDDYSKKELCHLMYIGEAAFIPENKSIQLPCKSLLILGEKDRVGKVAAYNKEWAKRTGYPLRVIQNAAHNANDDNAEEVNKLIEDFILAAE